MLDNKYLFSNNLIEIYNNLGIEAVRELLYNELFAIFNMYSLDTHKNHIELLVDFMTFNGNLLPINRNGLNNRNVGPLMRSTFEQNYKVLTDAAIFSEKENFRDISSNIMIGKKPPIGTNAFELILD